MILKAAEIKGARSVIHASAHIEIILYQGSHFQWDRHYTFKNVCDEIENGNGPSVF